MGSTIGGLVGGLNVGGIVSGVLNANAASSAADTQAGYLKQAQEGISSGMDPAVVNQMALAADQSRAKNQLALQAQIDPALAAQRGASQQLISTQLAQIGQAPSDSIASQAAAEAASGIPGAAAGNAALVKAANDNLAAGATLPPDLQAALAQAGLEQAGQTTGAATARGAGGAILQQVLGTGGLNLQAQRQQQAANLLSSASNIQSQRQQVLQNLFPRLQQQQLSNLGAASNVLQQSNSLLPQAGLSGGDVANIWLQRVGALNGLTQQMGKVVSGGQLASGQAMAKAWGDVANLGTSSASQLIPN